MTSLSQHRGSSLAAEQRERLQAYPERFRARVAGRVLQVSLSAPGLPPRYEAVLEVEKSRPLPPISVHALSGIPMVEVVGDDLDDESEVAAEDDNDRGDAEDSATAGGTALEHVDEDDDAQSFPQYRVHRHAVKPAPLYPDHPPVAAGEKVQLVWHGQKSVPGITAGTYLRVSGMLSTRQSPVRIFNPRYEIVPVRVSTKNF